MNFNTECVMHWRLIIKEYSPELIYLKGQTNIVADALSRLNIDTSKQTSNICTCDLLYLAEHFMLDEDDLSDDIFPLQYKLPNIKIYFLKSNTNKMVFISNPFVEAVRKEF